MLMLRRAEAPIPLTTNNGGYWSLLSQGRTVCASQFPCIGKRKRRQPPRVLIQNQGPCDRRLGALAAVFALAEPAVDADRRALDFFQIHAGGVDQFCGVADFAAEPDRKTRLRLRMRRHRP